MNRMNSGARTLILAGTFAAAVLVAADRPAEACGGHYYRRYDPAPTVEKDAQTGRWTVRLSYQTKYYSFAGGNIRLNKVHLFSADEKLAKWIQTEGRSDETWKAITAAAGTHTCKDVQNGAGLVKVERSLGRALAKYYQLKTKRVVRVPDVMLEVEQPYQLVCNPPSTAPTAKRTR
jgi:hypothetical protein